MLRVTVGLVALAIGATVVLAQNSDAIKERKDAMKALSAAAKAPGAMVKGEAPFDLAKVRTSLDQLAATAAKAKSLFPDDSKSGDTAVLPVAFEKQTDLFAKFDGLASAAKAARAAIKDEASLKANWSKVVSNCGGCHKVYRKPK